MSVQYVFVVACRFEQVSGKGTEGKDPDVVLTGKVHRCGYQLGADACSFLFIDFCVIDNHFMRACHPIGKECGGCGRVSAVKAAAPVRMTVLDIHNG